MANISEPQVELALTEDLPCILYILQLASPLALDADVS